MIFHVAAAGEDRGRVVLQLASGTPSPVAIAAALRLAQAFGSEIESLFVEDSQLFDLAQFPFARQVSHSGQRLEALSPEMMARQFRHVAQTALRQVGAAARAAEVPLKMTIVREEPVAAVARACAECGPWNVVALADALTSANQALIGQLFAAVHDTTGILVTGPRARLGPGPVLIALEDLQHLEPMLRAAERLQANSQGGEIRLVVIAASEAEANEKEGQVRLALGSASAGHLSGSGGIEAPSLTILRAGSRHGSPLEVADLLRRLHGSFVLAHFGGFLVPASGDFGVLAGALECPLFLLR